MTDLVTDATDADDFSEEEKIRAQILARGAPPRHWDAGQLQFFTLEHIPEIKALAQGLSKEETLNFYGLSKGLLPEYDEFFFDIQYIRGRIDAKQRAVQNLFENMRATRGNGGVQATLAYLNRFADSFKGHGDELTGMPKAIRIEMVE